MTTEPTPRPCTPEWCESGQEPHDRVCDNALMPPMTKYEFVEFQRTAANLAIDAYIVLEDDDFEWTPEQVREMAVDNVGESATCYAGIGSCGRGWCDHS